MKWEYKMQPYNHDSDNFEAFLNQQGQENWELVTVVPAHLVGGPGVLTAAMNDEEPSGTMAIFKRQQR